MSLHDQLLADLEEVDDDDLKNDEEEEEDDDVEVAESSAMQLDVEALKESSVRLIAKLWDSAQLKRVLASIEEHIATPRKELYGPIEEDPEYKLIVESNNLTVEIDNEIGVVHKYVRDLFSKRFPELDQLVPTPLDYIKTVKALQNDLDVARANLGEFLASATIMVVSVTSSTTHGTPLSEEEMGRVNEACEISSGLDAAKARILEYVQSRMAFLAPNVTHIVGAFTAARLLGVAGGLNALANMPACNILVLGATKKALAGFSSAAALPHTGFIFYCPLVQTQPADYRRKCARLVAAKVALAARVDTTQSGARGPTIGVDLLDEIIKKIDKAQEPPPAKAPKPLPAPDDAPRKKRGGRRFRQLKEKYGLSDLRKQANRVNFGELEEDIFQDEMGFALGRAGKGAASGQLRVAEVKSKGHISKKLQKEIKTRHGGLSTIKGMSSVIGGTASVAFTPASGLEIATPLAQELKGGGAAKYFGSGAGFVNIKKRGADSMS